MTYTQKKSHLDATASTKRKERTESFKLVFELLKHMTTLSSGSILLLVTFIDKIMHGAGMNKGIGVAFFGFCISIIFAVGTMFFLSLHQGDPLTNGEKNYFAYTLMIAVIGFLIGMSGLAYSAYPYF